MKCFDNWFLKKVHWAWSIPQEADSDEGLVRNSTRTRHNNIKSSKLATSIDTELESRGVSFNLYSANGGHVVELSHIDEKLKRMKKSFKILTPAKKFGE